MRGLETALGLLCREMRQSLDFECSANSRMLETIQWPPLLPQCVGDDRLPLVRYFKPHLVIFPYILVVLSYNESQRKVC